MNVGHEAICVPRAAKSQPPKREGAHALPLGLDRTIHGEGDDSMPAQTKRKRAPFRIEVVDGVVPDRRINFGFTGARSPSPQGKPTGAISAVRRTWPEASLAWLAPICSARSSVGHICSATQSRAPAPASGALIGARPGCRVDLRPRTTLAGLPQTNRHWGRWARRMPISFFSRGPVSRKKLCQRAIFICPSPSYTGRGRPGLLAPSPLGGEVARS